MKGPLYGNSRRYNEQAYTYLTGLVERIVKSSLDQVNIADVDRLPAVRSMFAGHCSCMSTRAAAETHISIIYSYSVSYWRIDW